MELIWHFFILTILFILVPYISKRISLTDWSTFKKIMYDSLFTISWVLMFNFLWYLKDISEGKLYSLLFTRTESPFSSWIYIFFWIITAYAKSLIYMISTEEQEKERLEKVMSTHKEEIIEWIRKKY
jgi:hypothetical protein